MNITPINRLQTHEHHVLESLDVSSRTSEPTETSPIQPSLYAQRLERQLRKQPCVKTPPQEQPKPTRIVNAYKNTMHIASIACGLLILPSLTCVAIGPIGLIAPVALAVLAVICGLLAGSPTETMEQKRAERAAVMSEYDPR